MRILNPNTGKKTESIFKTDVYVLITDYGLKKLLIEVKIGPGQHIFIFSPLEKNKCVDISGKIGKSCSFDNVINMVVNDPYCTLYEFNSYDEMVENWGKIMYIDNIKTKYEEEKEEEE